MIAHRQPRACSNPIYVQMLQGNSYAIRMFFSLLISCTSTRILKSDYTEPGWKKNFFFKFIHGSVSCGPRKWGARKVREYINRKTKSRFSRIHNSVVFYLINPKVAVEVPAYQGRLHTKFEENRAKRFRDMSEQTFKFFFFFVFLHTWKNRCNSQTCTSIQLKFGTLVGRQKAIISINFGENPFKILRVIIDHLRKTKAIFRHAYSINHWLDQPENRYVARFNIGEVPFGG